MENNPAPAPAVPPPANAEPPPPQKKATHYLAAALGILILLAIFLPSSKFAQGLSYPIGALGIVAAFKFFSDSVRYNSSKNPLVRAFVILGSATVAFVIFNVCIVIAFIVGFSKDPNPQSTG